MLNEIELTDGSRELAVVGRLIREADRVKGQNVLIGFGAFLDVDPAGPLFFELMSVLRSRIQALEKFAQTVKDDELSNELRTDVIEATRSFAKLFAPPQLVTVWDSTRATCLPDANLKTLIWFGQTARRHRPLRVVNEVDRSNLLEKIDELIGELSEQYDYDWTASLISDGLARLRLVLQHLRFFGHDVIIEELLGFSSKLQNMKEQSLAGESSVLGGERNGIKRALDVVVLLGTLFILPDQIVTACDRYVVWHQKMLLITQKHSAVPLLSPPVAVLTHQPKISRSGTDETNL